MNQNDFAHFINSLYLLLAAGYKISNESRKTTNWDWNNYSHLWNSVFSSRTIDSWPKIFLYVFQSSMDNKWTMDCDYGHNYFRSRIGDVEN